MTRAILIALLLVGASCTGPGQYVWVDELPDTPPSPPVYRVKSGDTVQVRVWRQAELSTDAEVRPDGNITLPLVGDVAIGGLSTEEAAGAVATRIKGAELMVDPKVSVAITAQRAFFVTVLGEVTEPGRYPLEPGDTVLHVIGKAGGLTPFADPDGIYVVRAHEEPKRVRFSYERLSRGDEKALRFVLRDTDVVVVEP